MNEFCIEWVKGDEYAGVTAPSGTKLKNIVARLHSEHAEEIPRYVENKDGSVYAWIPVKWIRVQRPTPMTEEQKAIARERIKSCRK